MINECVDYFVVRGAFESRDEKNFKTIEFKFKNMFSIQKIETISCNPNSADNITAGPFSFAQIYEFLENYLRYKKCEEDFSREKYQLTQSYVPSIFNIICIENFDNKQKYKYIINFENKKNDCKGIVSDKLFYISKKEARRKIESSIDTTKLSSCGMDFCLDTVKDRTIVKKSVFFKNQTDESIRNLLAMIYIKIYLNINTGLLDIRFNPSNMTRHFCFKFDTKKYTSHDIKNIFLKLPPIFIDLKKKLNLVLKKQNQ
jgi:hypothetical protein